MKLTAASALLMVLHLTSAEAARRGGHREGDERERDIRQGQAIVAKLAAKYQSALVKYQKVFDDACKRAPAEFWTADGVHPTYSGHQLMADEWVRTVTQFYK
jgi:lysophospholipase L1-like esterase